MNRIVYRGRWKYSPMPPYAYADDEELAGIRREFKQRFGCWFTRIIGESYRSTVTPTGEHHGTQTQAEARRRT